MTLLDRAGPLVEAKAATLSATWLTTPARSAALGAGLAVVTISGGIAAFLIVFVVLVKVFA